MGKIKQVFATLFAKTRQHKSVKMDEHSLDGLFNELYDVKAKQNRVQRYLNEVESKEILLAQYEQLDKEEIHKLDVLAGRAKTIEEKKLNLKGRLISNNASLARLGAYEEELPDLISEMKIAEKRKRETESHIIYLEEEKEELYEERESLLFGYRFLKGFSGAMIILIAICLFGAFAILQTLREQIWIVLTGIGLAVVILLVGIVMFKDKIDKELGRNVILQQKAVRYLNKAKIRLFNQIQYLEFQYRKLGVDSVAKLELYYNRYLKNKNNERVYLQMNETLTEIEEEMLEILNSKGIEMAYIHNLSDWMITPKMVNEMKQIKEEHTKSIAQFEGLKKYEEELWQEIHILGEEETLKAQVKEAIATYQEAMMLDKTDKDA